MTAPRQPDFAAALLDPELDSPEGLQDAEGRPAGRRFDVYRNNVVVSLTDALITGFPVLTRLLGAETMRGLGRAFARTHPPAGPVMTWYGADLPAFLAAAPQLAHLPYLPDIARLELALRRAYHAADAAPVAETALAEMAPDALMTAHVTLAPAVSVLRSAWPIHAIWRYNTEADAPKPAPGAQDVVILRPGFDPYPALLPPGGAAWIAALQAGQGFGAAVDTAQAEAPDFDLAACLAPLLSGGAFTAITPEKDAGP